MPTSSTAKLRKKRGSVHGDFNVGAAVCQGIMDLIMAAPNWAKLNPVQKESMHMIAHKQQRIMTGDPNAADHWDDIAGYAHLVLAAPKKAKKRKVRLAAQKAARVAKPAKSVAKKPVAKKVAAKKRTLSAATKKKIADAIRARAKKKKTAAKRPVAKKAPAKKAPAKKSPAKKAVRKTNVVRLRSRRSGADLRNVGGMAAPTSPGGEAA